MDSDLAKFREEKGISIHEISTKLNIPEKFLLAIEELNFDDLPAPIFAKSQIKRYYSFFDLEPSIILEKYEEFSKEKNISDEDENLESSESFFSNFVSKLLERRITILLIAIFSLSSALFSKFFLSKILFFIVFKLTDNLRAISIF